MAVSAQAEQDHARLARVSRAGGLVDHGADRVRGLGSGDDPLGAREPHRGLERLVLFVGSRLDQTRFYQAAYQRRVAVVAQAAGVHGRRHEVVSKCVHRHQRRHSHCVAEVVCVGSSRQCGARGGFCRDETGLGITGEHAANEGDREAAKVGAPSDAPDHDVRLLAGEPELRDRLLPNHRLMQQHVV